MATKIPGKFLCNVCKLPDADRVRIDQSLREGGKTLDLIRAHPDWGIKQPVLSHHKTCCLGLPKARGGRKPPIVHATALEVIGPEGETAITGREPWVPQAIRDKARTALLTGLAKLETQIDANPTAAYYTVRLAYVQAILAEADKVGGDPQDRMKSYEQEVRAKLEGKSKREITRTVTMTEKTSETIEPVIEGQVVEVT
jgi:hypothetical protein